MKLARMDGWMEAVFRPFSEYKARREQIVRLPPSTWPKSVWSQPAHIKNIPIGSHTRPCTLHAVNLGRRILVDQKAISKMKFVPVRVHRLRQPGRVSSGLPSVRPSVAVRPFAMSASYGSPAGCHIIHSRLRRIDGRRTIMNHFPLFHFLFVTPRSLAEPAAGAANPAIT